MKNVLSSLHDIINELENNDFVKEAHILNNLFTKLAVSDPMRFYKPPALMDISGEPNPNITEFSSGHPRIDEKIHKSPSYQKLKKEWLNARQAYIVAKKTSYLSVYNNPALGPENAKKEEELRKDWIEAEEILESWYIGAYSQVATGRPIKEIPKLKLIPIDDETRNRKRPGSLPTVKPTNKNEESVSKPVIKPSQPSAPKPVNKPVVPKPEAKPKQQLKEQVKPIQSELTKDQIYFKAQMAFVDYQAKEKELGSKVKAYNEMQAQVYNSDKTKGKQIYREWEKLVNLDNDENEK